MSFTRMITAKFTTRSDDLDEVITKKGGAQVFHKMVQDEYKCFLVIKCVELIAASRKEISNAAESIWLPSVHASMQACRSLLAG
mmetsp:Transcript_23774/g.43165  ORF Transcript_23774/g.43165 Transcript_23774/m.43165 type:complete len:84 (-) Transcript_23774:469-720(-)